MEWGLEARSRSFGMSLGLRLIFEPARGLREISVPDLRFLHGMLTDAETAHLKRPCRDESTSLALPSLTMSDLKERYRERGEFQSSQEWIVELAGERVGSVGLVSNMKKRLTPAGSVAWFAIGIARASERRRGLGSQALRLLEAEARSRGFAWAEVGVFSFNEPSLRFFEKNGYLRIGESPDATWWNGRFWPGIHLAKKI